MKQLFMACALFALLATGCGEEVGNSSTSSHDGGEVMEVNKDALESAIAANSLTLVDFTATW